MTMTRGQWLLLVALSLLWGGSFYFVEIGLRELPPFSIVWGRVGFAALVLLAVVRLGGERLPTSAAAWRGFFVMGAINNLIPFSLIAWGQAQIDSGLAAILNATTPLFTVVLAHWLTRDERMTPGKLAGVLIGLGGVVVLIGPGALRGLGAGGAGMLAILGAAVSYALASLYGRRFRDLPPTVAAAGMLCASALLATPLALAVDRPWRLAPGAEAWAAVLGIALLSTALAYLIYFRLLRAAGSTNLMLVTFLIPVSALVFGIVLLGERPGWPAFLGMALIFAGLAVIDGRVFTPFRRARAGGAGTPG